MCTGNHSMICLLWCIADSFKNCFHIHSSYWSIIWYGGRGRFEYLPRPGCRPQSTASGLYIALVIQIPAVTALAISTSMKISHPSGRLLRPIGSHRRDRLFLLSPPLQIFQEHPGHRQMREKKILFPSCANFALCTFSADISLLKSRDIK